ncbi:MAG TPA: endonuclease/exonuclease/phosphatase family protein [Chloroflexia bacterium]|nr:endonuclease/exonuclease/phosphatase family protein [Chloroflexia bacterium]
MKILTWNIWQYAVPWDKPELRGVVPGYPADAPRASAGPHWVQRRAGILATLAAERPDVVLLQECATDAEVAPDAPNQAAQLAGALGYTFVYHPAAVSSRRPAEFGQAVLAAPGWTIQAATAYDLPGGATSHDTTRIVLRVDLAGPAGPLRVLDAHFSLDAAARLRSVEQLLAQTAGGPAPLLLAGDLNDVPDSAPITRLTGAGWQDCWAAVHPTDPGFTFATPAPFIRLDYVFQAPAGPLRPVAARRVGITPDSAGFFPSDHAGVLVEFATA